MFFLKFIIFTIAFHFCSSDVPISTESTITSKRNESILVKGHHDSFKMLLPFMDMDIQNERNVHIIQERKWQQQFFVLHGSELFKMFLNRQEKRLSLIGLFAGSVRDAPLMGAQVILWDNYFIFVIALEDQLEIYQIAEKQIRAHVDRTKEQSSDQRPKLTFDPIQRLSLPGRYQMHFLVESDKNQVLLIVAVQLTKLLGRLRTYAWTSTYFDPIEELTMLPMHVVSVIGGLPRYLVTGHNNKQETNTILTIYEIMSSDLKLRNRQTFTVASCTVHAATFKNNNYIIACTGDQKVSSILRMVQGQFQVIKQRDSQELCFDTFIAGPHFLLATHQNEVRVFTSGNLDCYTSITTKESAATNLFSLVNEESQIFILLAYKSPFHTLVRMIEVTTDVDKPKKATMDNIKDTEELDNRRQHQHLFENTIGKLRSILLQLKRAMDSFPQTAGIISPYVKNFKANNRLIMQDGHINLVKVTDMNLRSPLQLLERIEKMRRQLGYTRMERSTGDFQSNLTSSLKIRQLKVRNLIYVGNFLKDKLMPLFRTISVHHKLATITLNTTKLFLHQNIGHNQSTIPTNKSVTMIKSQALHVQRINNITWKEFYDSVFLRNRNCNIQGTIKLKAETNVVNFWTTSLNDLIVDQLFDVKLPQVISSNTHVSRFFVKNLQANNINGLNFAKDIVFSGVDYLMAATVIMYDVIILGDLLLANDTKVKQIKIPHTSSLQQHYTNEVILYGSLTTNYLSRENMNSTKVTVNSSLFSPSRLYQNYLLRTAAQRFHQSVTNSNTKVTTPSVNTLFLNDHLTCEHLLTTGQINLRKPIYIVLMLVHMARDIFCNDYNSTILNLHKNAVRHGDIAKITAAKLFNAPLTFDNLMTLSMNNLLISEMVLKSQLIPGVSFIGVKHFESLQVYFEINVAEHLNCGYLNNLSLSELLNYDYRINVLHLAHRVNVSNIVFHHINELSFDRVFSQFNVRNEELVLHKDLIIKGNVKLAKNLKVQMINNIEWRSYQESLIHLNEKNYELQGRIRFLKELTIMNEFFSPIMNHINIIDVFDNKLLKSKPQQITGVYTLDSLRVTNLDVAVVNDLPSAAFIDMRSEQIIIGGDVVVSYLMVTGIIKGDFGNVFQLDSVKARLLGFLEKQWNNLAVLKVATGVIEKSKNDRLQYLLKNAVRRTGEQIISGNVRVTRPLVTKMVTHATYPDNIDFDFIAKDCLIKNITTKQVITGPKTFIKVLHVQSMEAKSFLNVKKINNVDVLQFNASLIHLSSNQIINGKLIFKTPPVIGHLAVEGFINGMRSVQIHHVDNNVHIPPLRIKRLGIANSLEIEDINEMNLNYLLENRITTRGDALEVFGFLTFENLILNKDLLLQSINGIIIEELVFSHANHLQAIGGTKVFTGKLVFAGPVHAMLFNGQNVIKNYHRSTLTKRNQPLDSLVVDQAKFKSSSELVTEDQQTATTIINDKFTDNKIEVLALNLQRYEIDIKADGEKEHMLFLDFNFNTDLVWQIPHELAYKTFTYEIERLSICERRFLHVQKSRFSRRILFSNETTSLIKKNANDINITAENFCNLEYRKVRSKIEITGNLLTKVFGMKKFIEDVDIFSPDRSEIFVLLHAFDTKTNNSEIRILKISSNQKDISDWQSITEGIGRKMSFFQLYANKSIILSATFLDHIPAVSIYKFEVETQQFRFLQKIVGNYDIMEISLTERYNYQLILSCRHCHHVSIYEYTPKIEREFQIYQVMKFKSLIDKILTFSLKDGSWFMLVLLKNTENVRYHLYKYRYKQGWLQSTSGYFHKIKTIIPLINANIKVSDGTAVLLICGSDKCNLVEAAVH